MRGDYGKGPSLMTGSGSFKQRRRNRGGAKGWWPTRAQQREFAHPIVLSCVSLVVEGLSGCCVSGNLSSVAEKLVFRGIMCESLSCRRRWGLAQMFYVALFNVLFLCGFALRCLSIVRHDLSCASLPVDLLTAYVHLAAWHAWAIWRRFLRSKGSAD